MQIKFFEFISIFTYGLSKLIPKKKNRWIFGAWFGNAVSDNTKAFYDYVAKNHPEIERVWIASDPSKAELPGCTVVRRNSLSSLKYILTARVAVMNQGFGDFAAYNFLGGAYKTQLWHGVAWKKIGMDAYPDMKGFYRKVFHLINHYDLYIAPSKDYGRSVHSAFQTDDTHIIYTGQPRNENLFSDAFCRHSHEFIEKTAGVQHKKLIVYMPTFRDKSSKVFSFHQLEHDTRFRVLAEKAGFVVIEKLHYRSSQKEDASSDDQKLVYGMPEMDAATLLGAADMLITDYSSCFLDYLITDRPVIHYAYDYDYYKNKDRGLYYDIDEIAAGTVAATEEELISALEGNLAEDLETERRQRVRDRFITFESDHSSADIYARIMKDLKA